MFNLRERFPSKYPHLETSIVGALAKFAPLCCGIFPFRLSRVVESQEIGTSHTFSLECPRLTIVEGYDVHETLLGNLWRRRALPQGIGNWSLTSLQQRLVKTGGRLIKHARYYWLLLAEGHLTRRLFAGMLRKIAALPSPAG